MVSSSRTACIIGVAILATVIFQAHQGETACEDLKNQTICCSAKDLNCSWCVQNISSPSEGVCGAIDCVEGSLNLCKSEPQPVFDKCKNYTDKQNCCRSNCSYCQGPEQSNDTCSSQCIEGVQNTCVAPATTTTSTTAAPTIAPAPECGTLNETSCCETSGRCSFCTPKEGGSAGICKDNDKCTDTEVDKCAASPTIAPPAPSPTESTLAPTTAPSGGGGGRGQHFDAASFIGGIILCGGIFAIVYFGCKFYKARKDQNYHTL